MNINSESTIKPSHCHNIIRSLLIMNLCDEKFKKHHKQSNEAGNFVMISMLFLVGYGKIVPKRGILSIMGEHINTVKAHLPDVLSESDYLPIYASFQSYPAFLGKKPYQKQAIATLKNSKTQTSSSVTQILPAPTLRGSSPLQQHRGDHLPMVALRHYDSNSGQIMNKEMRILS